MVEIILNMDMPKGCKECRFMTYMYRSPEPADGLVRVCMLTRSKIGANLRPIDCPMEELQ